MTSDALGQGVTVSAVAPDAIELGNDTQPRLNLFMHQATPNAAWRNVGLPVAQTRAGRRIANPPLALDLHYLLTAYGSADLAGRGPARLRNAAAARDAGAGARGDPQRAQSADPPVTGSLLPSIYQALRASDLADQFEQIKITPAEMDTEELSKLWTALQAHYRPTAPYLVTVVLIEAAKPARAPLPVLSRGYIDPVTNVEPGVKVQASLVPPLPEIETVTLAPRSQSRRCRATPSSSTATISTARGQTLLLTN